ncbi:amino acid transporter AVT1D-like isoform X2 [Andrographis paniculata]|uniref:amino acid transporter AVT1D-like isoform X2 n=1 Tax=Andrographis paniculata TaxID=175694 RepID=UPI0021E70FBA|nr:amino acid transporter AVT1D-like isoform X2 [Andrographis paniculata]
MKQLDQEFGQDRAIEIETDDEENEAQRFCDENDSESDTCASRGCSNECLAGDSQPPWPQSYRRSMDMYTSMAPPPLSYLKSNSFVASADKGSPRSGPESLFQPLVPSTYSDEEDVPPSILPVSLSGTSQSRTSVSELPSSELCSYAQSVLNATNVLSGIGILSTPYALKEGGWLSILLLFILGAITCYTGILLKRCLDSSSLLQTYPDIGQAAFGFGGRICISAILYIELYSTCVEYLIMMSDNLSANSPNLHMDVAGLHLDSYQICAVISTLVILPTVWLRNLGLLSYISVGGIATLILVAFCLLWVGVTSEVGFHASGKALNLTRLPIAVGIFSFCYGSHSVFPNIYSSMKEPSKFPSVLIISFLAAGLLYAGVAVCGLLMFGEDTDTQFTLNLPENLIASKVAAWAVVIIPVTKFGFTITPVALGLEELLPAAKHGSYFANLLIRTCLVVSTLLVALTVPYFGSVMALIGSFLVMVMSIILPCACYMRLVQERHGKLQVHISIHFFVDSFSLLDKVVIFKTFPDLILRLRLAPC